MTSRFSTWKEGNKSMSPPTGSRDARAAKPKRSQGSMQDQAKAGGNPFRRPTNKLNRDNLDVNPGSEFSIAGFTKPPPGARPPPNPSPPMPSVSATTGTTTTQRRHSLSTSAPPAKPNRGSAGRSASGLPLATTAVALQQRTLMDSFRVNPNAPFRNSVGGTAGLPRRGNTMSSPINLDALDASYVSGESEAVPPAPSPSPKPPPPRLQASPVHHTPAAPPARNPNSPGFSNLGNTCYMSAILVLLRSNAPFRTQLTVTAQALGTLPDAASNPFILFVLTLAIALGGRIAKEQLSPELVVALSGPMLMVRQMRARAVIGSLARCATAPGFNYLRRYKIGTQMDASEFMLNVLSVVDAAVAVWYNHSDAPLPLTAPVGSPVGTSPAPAEPPADKTAGGKSADDVASSRSDCKTPCKPPVYSVSVSPSPSPIRTTPPLNLFTSDWDRSPSDSRAVVAPTTDLAALVGSNFQDSATENRIVNSEVVQRSPRSPADSIGSAAPPNSSPSPPTGSPAPARLVDEDGTPLPKRQAVEESPVPSDGDNEDTAEPRVRLPQILSFAPPNVRSPERHRVFEAVCNSDGSTAPPSPTTPPPVTTPPLTSAPLPCPDRPIRPTIRASPLALFQFLLYVRTTCISPTCDYVFETWEVAGALPVSLPYRQSIGRPLLMSNLLKSHFMPSQREYTCERCKVKSENQLRYESYIATAPPTLVVVLNRFEQVIQNNKLLYRRRPDALQVEERLSIQVATVPEDAHVDTGTPLRCSSHLYKLNSVTVHSGSSLECGHYISFTRNSTYPQKWLRYDDASISEVRSAATLLIVCASLTAHSHTAGPSYGLRY